MTEEKAEEYAREWLYHVKDLELHHKEDDKPEYVRIKQAYLAGLHEGQPKWHDLRKDPKDLPKESCSVLVSYEYDDRTYTDNYINDKEHNIIGWELEYKDPYCSPRVIAWCEIPTFDKE